MAPPLGLASFKMHTLRRRRPRSRAGTGRCAAASPRPRRRSDEIPEGVCELNVRELLRVEVERAHVPLRGVGDPALHPVLALQCTWRQASRVSSELTQLRSWSEGDEGRQRASYVHPIRVMAAYRPSCFLRACVAARRESVSAGGQASGSPGDQPGQAEPDSNQAARLSFGASSAAASSSCCRLTRTAAVFPFSASASSSSDLKNRLDSERAKTFLLLRTQARADRGAIGHALRLRRVLVDLLQVRPLLCIKVVHPPLVRLRWLWGRSLPLCLLCPPRHLCGRAQQDRLVIRMPSK